MKIQSINSQDKNSFKAKLTFIKSPMNLISSDEMRLLVEKAKVIGAPKDRITIHIDEIPKAFDHKRPNGDEKIDYNMDVWASFGNKEAKEEIPELNDEDFFHNKQKPSPLKVLNRWLDSLKESI